jgi:hypothetical protein
LDELLRRTNAEIFCLIRCVSEEEVSTRITQLNISKKKKNEAVLPRKMYRRRKTAKMTLCQGKRRLEQAAAERAHKFAEGALSRVRVVPGDLSLPNMGLPHDTFRALCGLVDVIYHSGAIVNWLTPYLSSLYLSLFLSDMQVNFSSDQPDTRTCGKQTSSPSSKSSASRAPRS